MKFARRLDQVLMPLRRDRAAHRCDADGWHRRDLARDRRSRPARRLRWWRPSNRPPPGPETLVPVQPRAGRLSRSGRRVCQDRFGVSVDPESEVIPVAGGKEAVAHVALAVLDPDDVALAPDPGYPPYTSGPVFAGAEVHYLLQEENGDHARRSGSVPGDPLRGGDLLYFNYPNNPTGAVVAEGFFEQAAAFTREHGLVAIHDSAYSEIAFDGYRPPRLPRRAGGVWSGCGDLLPLQGLERGRAGVQAGSRATARSWSATAG